jgi:hypothetical protein
MQIDQDLQSIFLSPVKRLVQILNTSNKWLSVKDKIWYRNADRIQPPGFDRHKVALRNVLAAMYLDPCLIYLF